uniref:C-type lectin domain-containing protein n=1 Tax=Accipiter nisus TaxID=211598 RepID=A0A8B9N5N5_9AVES
MSAGPKLPHCLLSCLLLMAFVAGDSLRWATTCPQKWLYYRGYCYGYFTARKTWAEAEDECSRYGPMGRLASIHSQGASRVLSDYIARQSDRDNTWIGLRDDEQWKWSDNSAFDYQRWDREQPNNLWDKEDCFEFWHDYPCNYKFPFLCSHQL